MRGLIVSRGLTPVSEMVSPLWGAYRSPQMRLGVLGDRFVQTSGRRTPPVYAAACPPRGRAGRPPQPGTRRRASADGCKAGRGGVLARAVVDRAARDADRRRRVVRGDRAHEA